MLVIPRITRFINTGFISKAKSPRHDSTLSPGEKLGEGEYGTVWQDAADPHKVIKSLKRESAANKEALAEECELFNRFYGAGAACLLEQDGCTYLKMKKVAGVSMDKVTHFPANAEHFFRQMISDMERKDIFHADLKLENIHYCARENRFYPIDMSNFFDITRQAGTGAQVMGALYQSKTQELVEFIRQRTAGQHDQALLKNHPGLRANKRIYW